MPALTRNPTRSPHSILVPVSVISQEETLDWLALRLVPGLGTVGSIRVLRHFESPSAALRASTDELEAAGLTAAQAHNIASGCSYDDAVDQHQRLLRSGAEMITYFDERYPAQLRDIFDPPLLVFAIGRTELLKAPSIAVVGTRRASAYGLAAAERLSSDLSRAGLCIISGMARGIDTAAHKAALNENGDTIAVFGCGVDNLYPAENRRLYGDIAKKGLLLSEFPMGTPAYPQHFPIRNRIVSGISVGVLIVEGAQHSGSTITARLAMDQGREVFAVPGNITNKMSWAPNLLIKQGAKLVQEWSDVTNELPAAIRRDLVNRAQQKVLIAENGPDTALPEFEDEPVKALGRKILNVLQVDEPTQLETLVESLEGVSSSELIGALFDLEMSGSIRQLPGRNYVKVW